MSRIDRMTPDHLPDAAEDAHAAEQHHVMMSSSKPSAVLPRTAPRRAA